MSRRRSSRKKKQQEQPLPPMNPMGMEKTMDDIHRLLEEQEFENIDDANAFLDKLIKAGPIPHRQPETALERAQDLMYDTWEADGRRAIRLAKKALKTSPDCADAYVFLADNDARDIVESRDLYQKGVEAGERALGEDIFAEDAGHFWGITETRPYMRAREGLANLQWLLGHRDEAIAHIQGMLRLNPGDNQGVRYTLMHWLLQEDRGAELEQLFTDYGDDVGVNLMYSRTLYAFRQEGDSQQSRKLLNEAIEWNKHVPDFLLHRKAPPIEQSPYITMGGEDEAAMYFGMAVREWQATPGALEWLARRVK